MAALGSTIRCWRPMSGLTGEAVGGWSGTGVGGGSCVNDRLLVGWAHGSRELIRGLRRHNLATALGRRPDP